MSPTTLATLLVRIFGLLYLLVGLLGLIFNVAESYRQFDPSYFGYYFASELLRPLLIMGTGAIVHLLEKPLARWLSRGLD